VYALGAIYQEKVHIYPGLQLTKDNDVLKVEFPVGEGSPYEVREDFLAQAKEGRPVATPGPMGSSMGLSSQIPTGDMSVSSFFQDSHQKLALGLAMLIILLSGYYLVSFNKNIRDSMD